MISYIDMRRTAACSVFDEYLLKLVTNLLKIAVIFAGNRSLTQFGLIIRAIRCKSQQIRHLPRGRKMRIIETEMFSNRYPKAG